MKLTTKAFAELKAHPEIGRAEALRRSMVELIQHSLLEYAHPTIWAPFVLVGEGGGSPHETASFASPAITPSTHTKKRWGIGQFLSPLARMPVTATHRYATDVPNKDGRFAATCHPEPQETAL